MKGFGPERPGGQGLDSHQEESGHRAIHALLTSAEVGPHLDLVITWRAGADGGAYEVWSKRGLVRFRRVLRDGGALGFELSARSTYDKSKTEEDDKKQDDLYSSANTKRHVAMGFGAASVVCAGAAVWFYLRGGTSEATSTSIQARRLILEPIVGSDHAGLVLTGQY